MATLTKMAIWRAGKADIDRFENASDLDTFLLQVEGMKPGDLARVFVSRQPDGKPADYEDKLEFAINPQPPSMYEDMYMHLIKRLPDFLPKEHQALLAEELLEVAEKHNRV